MATISSKGLNCYLGNACNDQFIKWKDLQESTLETQRPRMRTIRCIGDPLMGEPWNSARTRKKWPVKVPYRKPVKLDEPWFSWPWDQPPNPHAVKTESEVRRFRKELPDPPCVACSGHGRVNCGRCQGRGRTNYTDMVMLPRGVWPQWCWYCQGSGLSYCSRCMGTGEKRGVIGFHLPPTEDSQLAQSNKQ